jgi:hypothetical protein
MRTLHYLARRLPVLETLPPRSATTVTARGIVALRGVRVGEAVVIVLFEREVREARAERGDEYMSLCVFECTSLSCVCLCVYECMSV